MRTDQLNVELFEGAPKLRQSGAREGIWHIYTENAKLIAIEGQRFTKLGEL